MVTERERANELISREHDRSERENAERAQHVGLARVTDDGWRSPSATAKKPELMSVEKKQDITPPRASIGPSQLEQFAEIMGEEFARLEKKHAAEIAELRVQLRAQCEARAQ